MSSQIIQLAAGTNGLNISIPTGVDLLQNQAGQILDSTPPIGIQRQQEILRSALVASDSASLLEAAKGHRRVAILAGGTALPAPYDILLPILSRTLEEAGIRPTRVSLLTCPPGTGPLLGRAAVRRYGDDFVGDHECQTWQQGPDGSPDPLYANADLRIAIAPWIPPFGPYNLAPGGLAADFHIHLGIGSRLQLEIESARCLAQFPGIPKASASTNVPSADVTIVAGGGGEWESTLEEAILSLHLHARHSTVQNTVVLAYSGVEGLGSAHFTLDFWSLLDQAEEMLAQGQPLTAPEDNSETGFEPVMAFAAALAKYKRIVLYSPGMGDHEEGDDLIERLGHLPKLSERLRFAAREPELWEFLKRQHQTPFSVAIQPLGWRAYQAL